MVNTSFCYNKKCLRISREILLC